MILAIPGSFDAVESVVLKSGKTQKDPTLTAREIWESGHKCLWIVLDRAGMSIRPPLFSVTPIAHPRNWYLIQLSRSPRALCGGFTAHHFTTFKRFHRIGPGLSAPRGSPSPLRSSPRALPPSASGRHSE